MHREARLILPGATFDDYRGAGAGLRVNGTGIAKVDTGKPREPKVAPASSGPTLKPDPGLELERAAIGAIIVGASSAEDMDAAVRHLDHRRIVDVLSCAVFEGDPAARLRSAIRVCVEAGLPPELRGAVVKSPAGDVASIGYLDGCVRRWAMAPKPAVVSDWLSANDR